MASQTTTHHLGQTVDAADLALIWNALHCYREDCISGNAYDREWDDICTVMANITEQLGLDERDVYAAEDAGEPSLTTPAMTLADVQAELAARTAYFGTLWCLLSFPDQRDGYMLKPVEWQGPGEYQLVEFKDNRTPVLIKV